MCVYPGRSRRNINFFKIYKIFEQIQTLQMFQQQIAKRLLTINNNCNLGKRSALSLCGPRFKKGRPFYVYCLSFFLIIFLSVLKFNKVDNLIIKNEKQITTTRKAFFLNIFGVCVCVGWIKSNANKSGILIILFFFLLLNSSSGH
jgi:hypothetical protein